MKKRVLLVLVIALFLIMILQTVAGENKCFYSKRGGAYNYLMKTGVINIEHFNGTTEYLWNAKVVNRSKHYGVFVKDGYIWSRGLLKKYYHEYCLEWGCEPAEWWSEVCLEYICENNESYYTPTDCNGQCGDFQVCSEEKINNYSCYKCIDDPDALTCFEEGGAVCTASQICDGETVATKDAGECCLGSCVDTHYCSDPDQIILRLSFETNAYAEIWTESNYKFEICYDDIFGEEYTRENPHDCNDDNRVLSLDAETEARGSTTHDPLYNIDVCYGNLVCRASITNCNAADGEGMIVALNGNTNALFAINDESYLYKICCKEGVLEESGNATWRNLINQKISRADIKDTVRLVIEGQDFAGKEINYTIYKDVFLWFDKKVAQSSSMGYTIWRAGEHLDGSFIAGNYYFEAVLEDGSKEKSRSGILQVTSPEKNEKPVAVIVKPEFGQVYDGVIDFEQASYDVDDSITTKWKFGDDLESSVYNTEHTYASDGQKHIILEVTDARGLKDSASTDILVCGGSTSDSRCLFAGITSPRREASILGREINFDATSSFALQYIGATGSLNCIGGLCPETNYDGDNISNTPNWIGFELFYFNWTFLEKSILADASYFETYGMNGAVFTKQFRTPATQDSPHKALLKLNVISLSSSTETEFSMNFTQPYCDFMSQPVGWWDTYHDTYTFIRWDSEGYNCYRDIVEYGPKECCPLGFNCTNGDCIGGGPTTCGELNTQDRCNANSNYPYVAANQLIGIVECNKGEHQYDSSSICFENTNCFCHWNGINCSAASNTTVRQNLTYYSKPLPSNINEICNVSPDEPPPDVGVCDYTITYIDNCNTTRQKIISWTGVGENCEPDDSRVITCLSGVLLDFFTTISLVIAILIIIIFYLIVSRKRKHYRKLRKKKRR